ncbi:MAG: phosphodiesterase [Hyphomicrobiales bacterium]|nr:phosphodiesterase [Hyphomicrobiales bacterium]
MTKLIHLSDVHMCDFGSNILGLDPAQRLEKIVSEINTMHADAAACIVTGDLADAGDEPSYLRLKEQLTRLVVPIWLTLGNHDRRSNYRAVFGDNQLDTNGFAQQAFNVGEHRVIVLDTLDESLPGAGRLCEKRLQWLSTELGRSPRAPTIIFMHHPPVALGEEYFRDMSLLNSGDFFAVLNASGGVNHIAFGHIHFPVSGVVGNSTYSSSRGTCHTIAPVLRGRTATFIERNPSFAVILLGQNSLTVHHMEPVESEEIIAIERLGANGAEDVITIFRGAKKSKTS